VSHGSCSWFSLSPLHCIYLRGWKWRMIFFDIGVFRFEIFFSPIVNPSISVSIAFLEHDKELLRITRSDYSLWSWRFNLVVISLSLLSDSSYLYFKRCLTRLDGAFFFNLAVCDWLSIEIGYYLFFNENVVGKQRKSGASWLCLLITMIESGQFTARTLIERR